MLLLGLALPSNPETSPQPVHVHTFVGHTLYLHRAEPQKANQQLFTKDIKLSLAVVVTRSY